MSNIAWICTTIIACAAMLLVAAVVTAWIERDKPNPPAPTEGYDGGSYDLNP